MTDLIDRQEAIDFINAGHLVNPNEPRWSDNEVVNLLKSRPSADAVEIRHGYWIESDADGFVCSVCRNGYRNQPTLMGKPMFDYCPVCGARMDGEA